MGGIHIAEALQIPYFRAFTMPWTRTRAYPHAFAVPERKMGGGYNYMTCAQAKLEEDVLDLTSRCRYTMFDAVFWRAIAGQINRWRRKQLGLHGTSLEKLEPHRVPFMYNFSKRVVPPPLDWYEWVHVTGYWFLDGNDDAGQKWEPPEALVEFLTRAKAHGKKVVYIGFGSVSRTPPSVLRAIGSPSGRRSWFLILRSSRASSSKRCGSATSSPSSRKAGPTVFRAPSPRSLSTTRSRCPSLRLRSTR